MLCPNRLRLITMRIAKCRRLYANLWPWISLAQFIIPNINVNALWCLRGVVSVYVKIQHPSWNASHKTRYVERKPISGSGTIMESSQTFDVPVHRASSGYWQIDAITQPEGHRFHVLKPAAAKTTTANLAEVKVFTFDLLSIDVTFYDVVTSLSLAPSGSPLRASPCHEIWQLAADVMHAVSQLLFPNYRLIVQ